MSSLFFENYDFVSPPHYRVVDVVLLSSMVVSAGYLHYTTLHSTTTHHLKFTSTDWMRLWRPEPKILRVKHKIWGWSDSAINIPYLFRFSLFFLTPDWDPPTSQQTLNIPSIVLSPLVLWCHSVLLEFFQILCIILIFPNRKTTRPNFPPPFCLHIDDTLRFVPAIHLLPVASLFFSFIFMCVSFSKFSFPPSSFCLPCSTYLPPLFLLLHSSSSLFLSSLTTTKLSSILVSLSPLSIFLWSTIVHLTDLEHSIFRYWPLWSELLLSQQALTQLLITALRDSRLASSKQWVTQQLAMIILRRRSLLPPLRIPRLVRIPSQGSHGCTSPGRLAL